MKVSMIGPVPVHWGGGTKWRGGGVSTHIQGMLGALSANSVQIQLLADNVIKNELPSINLPAHIQIQPAVRSLWQLIYLNPSLLMRLIKRFFNKDVRSSIPWSQIIRFIGLSLSYEKFLTTVSADIVHVQHILHRPYICKRVLQLALPFIVTVQSVNYLMETVTPWHLEMALANYRTADRLIAVSNYVKEMMINHGADAARIQVIPNGVDISMFKPASIEDARNKLGLPLDTFIVLFTGNLVPRKGVDVLLKAFQACLAKHSDSLLVILGDGSEREVLLALAGELGIAEQVQFAGFRMLPEMPFWYQACDLFVMPSWAEGLSLSILEAMAAAKPVITSYPTIGKHDAIKTGETGWLTSYGEVAELAKVLIGSMERPILTKEMGEKARQMAEDQFSWEVIGKRTLKVYQAVLARSSYDNRLYSL